MCDKSPHKKALWQEALRKDAASFGFCNQPEDWIVDKINQNDLGC